MKYESNYHFIYKYGFWNLLRMEQIEIEALINLLYRIYKTETPAGEQKIKINYELLTKIFMILYLFFSSQCLI